MDVSFNISLWDCDSSSNGFGSSLWDCNTLTPATALPVTGMRVAQIQFLAALAAAVCHRLGIWVPTILWGRLGVLQRLQNAIWWWASSSWLMTCIQMWSDGKIQSKGNDRVRTQCGTKRWQFKFMFTNTLFQKSSPVGDLFSTHCSTSPFPRSSPPGDPLFVVIAACHHFQDLLFLATTLCCLGDLLPVVAAHHRFSEIFSSRRSSL